MKNKLTDKQIERVEEFLSQRLFQVKLTPEQWRQIERGYRKNYKKFMIGLGTSGVIIYLLYVMKKYILSGIVKLFTVKGAILAATTIGLSGSAYFGYKYIQQSDQQAVKSIDAPVEHKQTEIKKDSKEAATIVRKLKKPSYKPNVGIMRFEAQGDEKALSGIITKKIISSLSKKKFRFIQKREDGKGHVNIFVSGNVMKIDDRYVIIIKATNLDYKIIFSQQYQFKDKSHINAVCKKIAGQLSNAGL